MAAPAPTARGRRAGGLRSLLRSTRARTAAVQVLLVLVALAISVAVSRELLLNRLDQRVARQLLNETDELRALASTGVDPATGRPFAQVDALMRTQLERSVPDRSETQFSIVDGRVDARSSQTP